MRFFITFSLILFIAAAIAMVIREYRNGGFRLRYYDCRMRLCSSVMPVALTLIDILVWECTDCHSVITADLVLGPLVLLLCPARHEKAAMSYRYAFMLFVLQMVLSLSGLFVDEGLTWIKVTLSMLTGQAMLVWYLVRRSYIRYENVRKLFTNLAVWHGACDMSRFVYAMALSCVMCLVMQGSLACAIAAILFTCTLYVLCYVRVTDDTSLLIGKDVEIWIKDAIKGRIYDRAGATPEDDRRMVRMYERAKAIMCNDKPYKNELFSLPDFASMLLTNKVYLSRTINLMAGCNFRNFINWYRIEEAKNLIDEHPEMKLADIMVECGYRTHQTFEAAFLRQCGEGPKEYQERMRYEKLKSRKG